MAWDDLATSTRIYKCPTPGQRVSDKSHRWDRQDDKCPGGWARLKWTEPLHREVKISAGSILVSYDVLSLCTNMPRSSPRNPSGKTGFNSTYDLNMPKDDLVDILSVATKSQLFQFNGALYKLKQISNVAMESPPRALVSMCVPCWHVCLCNHWKKN